MSSISCSITLSGERTLKAGQAKIHGATEAVREKDCFATHAAAETKEHNRIK
jgi:hypothetical protein